MSSRYRCLLTAAALAQLFAACSSSNAAGGGSGGSGLGSGGTTGSVSPATTGTQGSVGTGGVASVGTGGSLGSALGGAGGAIGSGSGGAANGAPGNAGRGGAGGAAGSGAGGAGQGSAGGGAAAPTTGCGKTPTLTSGMHSIQSGGMNRSFILRVPDNYDHNHPYRLIFAFHWVGGTANDVASGGTDKDAWSYYGLQQLSANSAILVAPQGISNGWGNVGGQDVTFVDDMVSQIEGDLCVDSKQVFSVGFSFGGAMTYALACARPTVFRAVAVYSGGQLSGCSGGTQPVAYLGIHGISDGTLDIAGGRAMRDKFVTNDGCTAQSPPEPSAGSLTHTCTSYAGCSAGHPVRWCAFDGGHTPGAVDGGGDSGARTWTKGEVWQFFTQF